MTVVTFPTYTDDTGDGDNGTIFDEAFWNSVKTGIDNVVHSTTNPTVTPIDIIDEVVSARGTKADLETFLDTEHNNDGTHNLPAATAITEVGLAASLGLQNLIMNDTFLMWGETLAKAPSYYVWDGDGAIARDTGSPYVGANTLKITRSGTDVSVYQEILDTGAFFDYMKTLTVKIGFGAWCYTNVASAAVLQLWDGNTSTTATHSSPGGDWSWEWLSGVHTISGAADQLRLQMNMNDSDGVSHWTGLYATFTSIEPDQWRPTVKRRGTLYVPFNGSPDTGDGKFYYMFERPAMITGVQAHVGTVPGGADDLDFDLMKYETGPSWVSLFTGSQTIISAAEVGGYVAIDGDYDHRCFNGVFGNTFADGRIRLDLDTVGGNVADISFMIRTLQYLNPLEDYLAYDDQ